MARSHLDDISQIVGVSTNLIQKQKTMSTTDIPGKHVLLLTIVIGGAMLALLCGVPALSARTAEGRDALAPHQAKSAKANYSIDFGKTSGDLPYFPSSFEDQR